MDLIAHVRLLVGDTAGENQVFNDQAIQDTLDRHKLAEDDYDTYAASADLLEMWAAKEKLAYDFSSDNQSFHQSQKAKALLELAGEYRKKQRVGTAVMVRSDVNC